MTTPAGATPSQIRDLAAAINAPPYNFDPGYMRKGTVSAINIGDANTPPTVTVFLSGDTTTPIAGVGLAANYSPQIGDMVMLYKQGNEFFAQSTVASSSNGTGWVTASLASGNTHNGNSNGSLMYRRVLDNGAWKMQWQGAINYGGSASILSAALPSDFRPSVKRSLISAREVQSGSVVVGLDFYTDGTVHIVGENTNPLSGGSHSHFADLGVSVSGGASVSGGTGGASAGTAHTHGFSGSGSSSGSGDASGNTNSGGSHSHSVNSPSWVGFSGVEYFL